MFVCPGIFFQRISLLQFLDDAIHLVGELREIGGKATSVIFHCQEIWNKKSSFKTQPYRT